MSLVYFHVFLIFCATMFSFVFGFLETSAYRISHQMVDLVTGLGAFIVGISLLIYWVWFVWKKVPSMRGK